MDRLYDYVFKGGRVIDPANTINAILDVAVLGEKIVAIESDIDSTQAIKTLDVAGLYITPGLIDMHCHIYPVYPRFPDSLPTIDGVPFMFKAGVTTAVDAGTCGPRDFLKFKEEIIDTSDLNILSFVNIASGGMVNLDSEQEPSRFQPKIAAAIADTYPDVVVGIKTAHYWVGKPFDDTHRPWDSVDNALEAAALCGKKAMIDFQPNLPERTYLDLLVNHMQPGDIHTHIFAQQFPILDESNKVNKFLIEARERGILFDLGHGAGSFWFRNAIPAVQDGFPPDTISTDLYAHNVAGPVVDILNIMSKFLNIGMDIEDVIKRTTMIPSRIVNHPEIGSLTVGSTADIAVLDLRNEKCGYADCGGAQLPGTKRLYCKLTMRKGSIVYNQDALTLPYWENAPSSYWEAPGLIT